MKHFLDGFVKAERMCKQREDGILEGAKRNLGLVMEAQEKLWRARGSFAERGDVERLVELSGVNDLPWDGEDDDEVLVGGGGDESEKMAKK